MAAKTTNKVDDIEIQEKLMIKDETRTRPSLIGMFGPCVVSIIHNINSIVLPTELNNKLKSGLEKGI